MMSIKHFFILVLSSFNILFACFYDDPNMIVHLKDTIVDCYSIKIVYNYPMEKGASRKCVGSPALQTSNKC